MRVAEESDTTPMPRRERWHVVNGKGGDLVRAVDECGDEREIVGEQVPELALPIDRGLERLIELLKEIARCQKEATSELTEGT